MDTWSLPKARPISCNDCPAFQRPHLSTRWLAESFTRLLNLINTTFREQIYTRWCCIDRLSWQDFTGLGRRALRWFTGHTGISQQISNLPASKSRLKITIVYRNERRGVRRGMGFAVRRLDMPCTASRGRFPIIGDPRRTL